MYHIKILTTITNLIKTAFSILVVSYKDGVPHSSGYYFGGF